MYKKILVIMAMPAEAKPVIEKLNFHLVENFLFPALPAKFYRSAMNSNKEIFLAVSDYCPRFNVSRVGTEAAAILAWETIKTVKPDLVINTGTAGGFCAMGAAVGDIFISESPIKYYHRNFHPTDENYYKYAIGLYPCIDLYVLAKKLQLKMGIVSSSDSLFPSEQENIQLLKNNTTVKEMEAAAIAEVAQLLKVDFVALKVITDIVDIKVCSQQQFDENFCSATEKLSLALKKVIEELTHDTVDLFRNCII
jgi:5'-methylthioadenosine nucleosidase